MAIGTLNNIKISGISCALPKREISNDFFVEYYGEKFVKRFGRLTGIKRRYWSESTQTASDLCFVAAKELLVKKHIEIEDVDSLIFLTQTADYKTPSTAFVLHKRLGMREDAIVFDINMGCTAMIHGVMVLSSMIQSGMIRNGLLLIGDSLPRRKVSDDHNASMMFSDAGAAVLLEKGSGNIPYLLCSDGNDFQAIMCPQGERFAYDENPLDDKIYKHYMDGEKVFEFATSRVPEAFTKYAEFFKTDDDCYDGYVFHQANQFIIKHIINDVGLPEEKVPLSLENYANTNGASIPVTIVDMAERNLLKSSSRLLLCGFGIGLSWGLLDITIDADDVLPMIFTDDYYKEGTDIGHLK